MKQLLALGLVGLVGCGGARRDPCEQAMDRLLEAASGEWKDQLGEQRAKKERAEAKAVTGRLAQLCREDRWSAEMIRCMGEAGDSGDAEDCGLLLGAEQRQRYGKAMGRPAAPPAEQVVKSALTRLASEAFPLWALAHPQQECPASVAELLEYSTVKWDDPWGHPYRVLCGAKLPAAAGTAGIAIVSDGPDGVPETDDDVRSW